MVGLRQHIIILELSSFSSTRRLRGPKKAYPGRRATVYHQDAARYEVPPALTASRSAPSHLTSPHLMHPAAAAAAGHLHGSTHGRVLPAPCPWARQTCSTGAVYKSSLTSPRRHPDLQAERQAS